MDHTDTKRHPRSHARRRDRLGLRDACAMAIGGMIGGGIFSVLGVTIELAGHLAFASFLVGAVLAAATARSLAQLAVRSGKPGGPFAFLREEGHPTAAAWVAWLLIAGYVFALAVYAFTFGHYIANVFGASSTIARVVSVIVLTGFAVLNLRGVSASAVTEDIVVAAKLAILAGIAVVGIAHFHATRMQPLADHGASGVLLAAAVIFVAYEGFELLPYDYAEIDRPERTLPRALYVSVGVVTLVYVSVTVGSQMLVSDRALVAGKEVAFAVVGQAALGTAGLWAATAAAALATSSAINATLFSTARLVRDVSAEGEFPARFGPDEHGQPTRALLCITVLGGAFAMLPGITQVVSFGSLTFLVVFALVNFMHATHTAQTTLDRAVGYLGAAGCAAAAITLVGYLAVQDRPGLALVGVVAALLVTGRLSFVHYRRVVVT